ncbi:MAG: PilZ domain-containing protein [Treponema sp.]|jgi:ubiquinone/menaquinone biosynthesis C-methylase UbiE|nr:PilZ domain-containing protein [Treponema sp.]
MSTQIKGIEKEYFLSKLIGEQIPILYTYNRKNYIFKVDKINKEVIELIITESIEGLIANKKINLMFDYKGLVISFIVEIKNISQTVITTSIPDALYKNLDRSNSRVAVPADLQIKLMSTEDRYSLPYPKSSVFEIPDKSTFPSNMDPKNFNAIIARMLAAVSECGDGHKIVYYSASVIPDKVEERIVSENGKTLFIPLTIDKLPDFTEEQQKYVVTTNVLKRYFESIGVGEAFLEQSIEQFIKSKHDEGMISALWVPLLFQEYVVGYIFIWKSDSVTAKPKSKPFDTAFMETIYQYSKWLVFSLKERGYFEVGHMKDRVINGKVIDVSASGLRFAVANSFVFLTLQPGVEIMVTLTFPQYTILTKAKIRRRNKEGSLVYLGCSFIDMSPKDTKFLFDFIYGNPKHESTEVLLSGNV